MPAHDPRRRPRADQLRLYVCNNDQSVRVFDLATMRQLASIATPTPSNHCALAPGGDMLACVGDAPDRGAPAVYLYRPTPAGARLAEEGARVHALRDAFSMYPEYVRPVQSPLLCAIALAVCVCLSCQWSPK